MDYIHFKKRIIVNTQYSMMFFAVDVDIGSEVYVSMFCSNGVYIACIVGSNTEIDAIIRVLESRHIVSNVESFSIFDMSADLDNSEHIIPDMSIISDFEMNLDLSNSKRITLEELSSLLNIEAKGNIVVSKPLKVDIESFCEVLAEIYVPPPIKEMSVNVELDFNFIVKGDMAESRLIQVDMPFSQDINSSMNFGSPMDLSGEITSELPLTINMANDEFIILIGSVNGQAVLNMFSLLKTSKPLKTNIIQNGSFSAIMRLIEGALLSNYDLLLLSNLDNLTLYELDYVGE